MKISLLILLNLIILIRSKHFNGGTIRWLPVYPYENGSTNLITITQSYSWSYPIMKCDINVPITTTGRTDENNNLTCVYDCQTDGNYSLKPVEILTDCISTSPSLNMMASERSVNITLNANAHFSIAYRDSAWRALSSPTKSGLDWSILCSIDLRKRDDGFINTPPVSSVVSPQYVIVNKTTIINIPVSDINQGDHIRCRWATYQQGYRKRKKRDSFYQNVYENDNFNQLISRREKRGGDDCKNDECKGACKEDCKCKCDICQQTTCKGDKCKSSVCKNVTTTTRTTQTTTPTTTESTVSEIRGTIRTTSVYLNRQSIDECAGICFPNTAPNTTTLSNCSLTFTGLIPGAWYAVAIQVLILYSNKLIYFLN